MAPARGTYRTDLAVSCNNLGLLENREGRSDAAEEAFRRSIDLYATHLQQFPADAVSESNLASVYSNLGVVQEGRGELQAAAEAFARAATHQSSAMNTAPKLPRASELLAKHRASQTRILQKLKEQASRPSEARKDVQPTSQIDYTESSSGIERNSPLLSRTR
jgi:Tfp pilus assembly protein PilF